MTRKSKALSEQEMEELLSVLADRFEKNRHRHLKMEWNVIEERIKKKSDKAVSLYKMEKSGGEPDVIGYDAKKKEYLFVDCSMQSPKGRRSLCYDQEALESRKEHPPKGNAVDMAAEMGIELLTEEQYKELHKFGDIDTTTSSWIVTPKAIRERGGALFADCRYNHVFVYHNGAQSYYAARGFRGLLRV